MKTRLIISIFLMSVYVAAQSPFANGIRIINTQEVGTDEFERIPVMYSNGAIVDWVDKDSLQSDLSDYFTKEETSEVISDSLENYIPITGTRDGNLLSGNIELNSDLPYGGFKHVIGDNEVYTGISDDGLPTLITINTDTDTYSSFYMGYDGAYLGSTNSTFYGIMGDEEFDKEGNRLAFAQISDLEDSISNLSEVIRDSILASKNYLNVLDFETIQEALDSANVGNVKAVYFPTGTHILSDTDYIYQNTTIFGDGGGNSIIQVSPSATLDILTLIEGNSNEQYEYVTMLSTAGASWDVGTQQDNITITGLGFDWNGYDVGENSATPILLGRTKNSKVQNSIFYDALPDDLDGTPTRNHGSHILMAFAEENLIRNNVFYAVDYENISNNYLSANNRIVNNVFYIDKPDTFGYQAHCIQTANVNSVLLLAEYGTDLSKNLQVEGNDFILINNIANGVTQHGADGMYVYNNYFKADGVTPVFVKPFDGATNFEVIGNTFEAIDVNGFELFGNGEFGFMAVSASNHASGLNPTANGIISNNTIRIKNSTNYAGSVPSYLNPLIGSNVVNSNANILISNNQIFIDGYDDYDKALISVRGNGYTVEGNIARLINPFEAQTSAGFSFLKIDNSSNVLVGSNNVTGILGNDIKYLNTNTKIKIGANNFDSVVNPITPIDNAEWVNLGKRITNTAYNKRVDYLSYNSRPFLTNLYERWNGSAWITGIGHGIGEGALEYATGSNLVANGYQAMQYATAGNSTANGTNALQRNAGAGSNGVGVNAGRWNTGADSNFMGELAGRYNNWADALYLGDNVNPDFVVDAATSKSFTNANITLSGQVFNITAHGFGTGVYNLQFGVTSGTPPTGLTNGSVYRFERIDNNSMRLLYDVFTDVGSGTFTLVKNVNLTNTIALGNDIVNTKQNQMILGNTSITETILNGVANGTGDFLTISAGDVVGQRTAAQTLTDIGAQPLDSDLTAIAGSTLTGDGKLTRSGVSWVMDNTDYATDSEVVKLTGNQTIADVKTFSSSPIVPNGTTGNQAVNWTQLSGYANLTSANTFTQDNTFNDGTLFDNRIDFTPQAGYPVTGYTTNYIKALPSGFAFGTYNSGTLKTFSFSMGSSLGADSSTTLTIESGGTIVTSSNLADQLKAISGYNASVAQVLGHDASGNLEWVAP